MYDSINFKILSSVYLTYTKQDSYVFANCQWQVIVILSLVWVELSAVVVISPVFNV